MDPLYLAYYVSLFVTPLIFYLVASRKQKISSYSKPTWYYAFKKRFAKPSVRKLQEEWRYSTKYLSEIDAELPQKKTSKYESDTYLLYATDTDGNYFFVSLCFKHTLHMDMSIEFRSKCGKTYKLPNEPSVRSCSTTSRTWKGAGLNVEVLNPLRRIRITFNGLMRVSTSQNKGKGDLEFVNFNFLWNAGSEPMFHPRDTHVELLTDSIAREPWRDGEWMQMLGKDYGFEQYGVLQGHFSSASFENEVFLYMPSWRKRKWGPADPLNLKRDFHVFGARKDGTVFCVGAKSYRIGVTQLRYGTILMSNGVVKPVSGSDICLEDLADNAEIPNIFTLHFEVDGKTFKCVSHVNANKISLTHADEEKGWVSKTTNVECDVNSEQAAGIVRFWYERKGTGTTPLPPPLLTGRKAENPEDVFVAPLTNSECLDLALTGGKGNSLGLLSSVKSSDFIVPPGFVITSTAFRRHLEEHPNLSESLEYLQDEKPAETRKNIVELFEKTPLSDALSKLIEKEINSLDYCREGFAVRSSAIGEDSEDLSAAGQNSTFLGCKTVEGVLRAVAACWGSLFTFQSIEYRRQHGLGIRCDMAVVVQKMVPSQCAGVLFTSHPTTGDPSQMAITSNYGLGESVVSAATDPDTVILAKSIKGNVRILGSTVGSKRTQIVLGETSTEEKIVNEELATELSISEEQALRLGKMGVFLENAFGNPQDIEWAFYNGELYLLQSRPITTLNSWSDWELQHEFDSPIMSLKSMYTRANVGEVVKGAVTPLSESIVMQTLDNVMQGAVDNGNYTTYHRKCLLSVSHFQFLDVINFLCVTAKKKITMEDTVMDLAVFGHKVLDENISSIALSRHGAMKNTKKLRFYWKQFEAIVNNKSMVKRASEINDMWKIKIKDFETPKAILDKIDFNLQTLHIACGYHTNSSRSSIIYQMVAMIVLAEKHDDFNTDHYHDISLLLAANSDVESAEIPVILEGIAEEIRREKLAEEFLKINPADGFEWFEKNLPKTKEKLDKFLKVHGHRSFREFELFEKTWDMQSETVISMLQSNCITETTTKKTAGLTVEETISKLISPTSKITRSILKFIVGKCRVAVASRETTKSVVIKTVHKFRTAFNELAKSMTNHGFIPCEDLVFFFTIEELRSHVKERNPTLVSKATRRRKLYERWNSLHFPEISYGVPIPENDEQHEKQFARLQNGVKVEGTPVCKGTVLGRACVITDIKEIGAIKPGDILITFSTDIAWSPYFPILSGVVTEIGGLISHGAVVAREYGLPCVVGARHATKYFKTGDNILLDGKTGVIKVVE